MVNLLYLEHMGLFGQVVGFPGAVPLFLFWQKKRISYLLDGWETQFVAPKCSPLNRDYILNTPNAPDRSLLANGYTNTSTNPQPLDAPFRERVRRHHLALNSKTSSKPMCLCVRYDIMFVCVCVC